MVPSPSNGIFVIFVSLTRCLSWNSSSACTTRLTNLELVPVGYRMHLFRYESQAVAIIICELTSPMNVRATAPSDPIHEYQP